MTGSVRDNIKQAALLFLLVIFAMLAVRPIQAEQSGTLQSIAFNKDVNTTDALRYLAATYHKNIVPSPSVGGVITVSKLYDVTFEEALDAVLGYRFKYDVEGELVRVYTADEYKRIKTDPARMVYKVFTLYYITAAEVSNLVAPVLSSGSKTRVTTAAESGMPAGKTISSDSSGGDSTALNDTIVIYDYPENIARAEQIINSVDVRPKQVLIEATIMSATLTEDTQFGIDWQTLMGTAVTGLSGITKGTSDYFKSAGSSAVTLSGVSGGMTIGLAIGNVGAFIEAVETVSDITILANPKILAINKQLGQVYIGRKVGYRDNPQTLEGGVLSEGEVKFLETGTKLSFRPYIGDDGYVRMDIHPKDSSGSLTAGIPNEDSAELVTNIMVKDGQTIVIGGLFRDKTTSNKTQIPLLGDLPVIGGVFRGTSDKTERQEVIVLLTPHIIEEPDELEGQARAEDVGRKRYGAKDGLQQIGRAKLAEDHYGRAVEYYTAGDSEAAMCEIDSALLLRPTYLEALRLKEKIIRETLPNSAGQTGRTMLDIAEQQEASNWRRY